MEKKYSVLTCMFGNYGLLHEVKNPDPDTEYICVTDDPELKLLETWTVVHVDKAHLSMPFVNQWTWVRYHPFQFVNTDLCLYVDGSIDIVDGMKLRELLIEPFANSGSEYGVLIHPWRSSITEELSVWVRERDYPLACAVKMIDLMKDIDYHVNGLFQSTIILQKKSKTADTINSYTFEFTSLCGINEEIARENQCPLTFVVNTMFYDSDKIFLMSPQVINSDVMHWTQHKTGEYWGWDGCCSGVAFDKENYGFMIQ